MKIARVSFTYLGIASNSAIGTLTVTINIPELVEFLQENVPSFDAADYWVGDTDYGSSLSDLITNGTEMYECTFPEFAIAYNAS